MYQKKDFTYDLCVPPISKQFAQFNSDEAKAYFDWYINIIPERIMYMSKQISVDLAIDEKLIDFSEKSLVLIWNWFLNIAQTEKNDSNTIQLDMQTEYIIRDVGMYLGEMFNSRYSCIKWSYYETPKTDFFVNRPLLIGFKDNSVSPPFNACFEPIHMVRVQASKLLLNHQSKDDLLKLYCKWAEKTT